LAWLEVDDDRCPGCGNPLSESTDHELRADWQAEKVACHACRVKDAKSDQQSPGEFVVVSRRS